MSSNKEIVVRVQRMFPNCQKYRKCCGDKDGTRFSICISMFWLFHRWSHNRVLYSKEEKVKER